jgi:hypothetical protein
MQSAREPGDGATGTGLGPSIRKTQESRRRAKVMAFGSGRGHLDLAALPFAQGSINARLPITREFPREMNGRYALRVDWGGKRFLQACGQRR